MTPEEGWGDACPGLEQRFSKDFFHFNLFSHGVRNMLGTKRDGKMYLAAGVE